MIICLFGQRYKDGADREKEAEIGTMLLDKLRLRRGSSPTTCTRRTTARYWASAWRDDQLHRSIWHHAPSFYEYFWIQNSETYREYVWTPGGRIDEDLRERFLAEGAGVYNMVGDV